MAFTKTSLEHYGVKGMKWGVRKDRSRKNSNTSSEKRVIRKRKETRARIRSLSDRDLDSMINRIEKEKKLRSLIDNDTATGRGKNFIKSVTGSASRRVLTSAAAGAATYAIKTALTKEFDPKDASAYITPRPKR